MQTRGIVRTWSEEGWGVVDAPHAPGGCWVHWSHVLMTGYRQLTPGQAVEIDYEEADQDGFAYRAVRVWPAGQLPVDEASRDDRSGAYTSTLTVEYDERRGDTAVERLITVDGEQFRVHASANGGYDFDWLTGKNPGYGFGSSWSSSRSATAEELEELVRGFLAHVDPVTGYIEDEDTRQ